MKRYLIIILLIFVSFAGCTTIEQEKKEPKQPDTVDATSEEITSNVDDNSEEEIISEIINGIMDKKFDAILQKDMDMYLSTITSYDLYYRNEQERWFAEMTKEVIQDISFEVKQIELVDDASVVAIIRQNHRGNKQEFDFEYKILFKFEDGNWYDYGYDFKTFITPRYTIKYMLGEKRIEEFKVIIDQAFNNLEKIFIEKPDENFQIKLYNDKELLRQRTAPSIAWLFTGWAEPNESVKLYTGNKNINTYGGIIQHELVHNITIDICNNNLSGWVLEGIAMYYGNAQYDHKIDKMLSILEKDDVRVTIKDLEKINLYEVTDSHVIWNWYNSSYMYVRYLIETYGHKKVMKLFYEAGEKPFNNISRNPKWKYETSVTTEEVLKSVLGLTKEELSKQYLKWLKTVDLTENNN